MTAQVQKILPTYLVKSLEKSEPPEEPEKETISNEISIELQYADDITNLSTQKEVIEKTKEIYPKLLKERGLQINQEKTEEYEISRTNPNKEWKKCKLLGSLLDTKADIKRRRKGLAIDSSKKLTYIFKSKNIWISTKMKAFNSYVHLFNQFFCTIMLISGP